MGAFTRHLRDNGFRVGMPETEMALRKEDLEKKPGIAETLDWAAALAGLGLKDLTDDPVALQASLEALLKTEADQATIPGPVAQRLAVAAG